MKRGRTNGEARAIDVYQNYMSWTFTQTSNTFGTTNIQTPIPRVGRESGGKITIMELLRWELVCTDSGDNSLLMNTATTAAVLIACLSTGGAPATIPVWSNPNVIAYKGRRFDVVTSGGSQAEWPIVYDFCNKDGRGFLLGTDSFNFSIDTSSIGTGLICGNKLFYRFVRVSLEEYVGIVQSQQAST